MNEILSYAVNDINLNINKPILHFTIINNDNQIIKKQNIKNHKINNHIEYIILKLNENIYNNIIDKIILLKNYIKIIEIYKPYNKDIENNFNNNTYIKYIY